MKLTQSSMLRDAPAAPAPDDRVVAPVVRIAELQKHFVRDDGELVRAVDGVTMDVGPGDFVVLLGPSGCGKTTLLRAIAGLEKPHAGRIEIFGRSVFDPEARVNVAPERRRLSMIFQSYALWPHMTVFENVAYPLRSQKADKAQIAPRVERILDAVGIGRLGGQYPSQLSGGQQQRTALARALVAGDQLVLFDEPLSNVDAKVREQLRLEMLTMQREIGFAAVYVTHDQAEAMQLADRIAVMEGGRVAQLGSPREIYDAPVSRYVADFVGSTNELEGTVLTREDGAAVVETALGPVVAESWPHDPRPGEQAAVICRPERAALVADEPATPNRWRCRVEASMFMGTHTEHLVRVGDTRLTAWGAAGEQFATGTEPWLALPPWAVRALPA